VKEERGRLHGNNSFWSLLTIAFPLQHWTFYSGQIDMIAFDAWIGKSDALIVRPFAIDSYRALLNGAYAWR
jgi:hypothetical protein